MIDRAIALLGVAAVVVLGAATMPNRYAKWRPFGYVVGSVLVVLAAVAWLWPENTSPANTTVATTGNENCNVVGSGNQVNCAPNPSPKERKTEDFQATFDAPTLDVMLSTKFSINFLFKNEGSSTVFLNGIGLFQIFSKSDAISQGFDFRGTIGDPYAFKAITPSPGPRWVENGANTPTILHDAITLTINGQEGKNAVFPISAHSGATVSASFITVPIDKNRFKQTVILPVIYAANLSGSRVSVVCIGPFATDTAWGDSNWINGPVSGKWISVLPRRDETDIECRIASPETVSK